MGVFFINLNTISVFHSNQSIGESREVENFGS